MKKQIFIVGIIVLLVTVGLSGCEQKSNTENSNGENSNLKVTTISDLRKSPNEYINQTVTIQGNCDVDSTSCYFISDDGGFLIAINSDNVDKPTSLINHREYNFTGIVISGQPPKCSTSEMIYILVTKIEEIKETQNSMIIRGFQITPTIIKLGETANLTWNVTGVTSVSIDNNIGNVGLNGTIIIQPERTTTYGLRITNETGSKIVFTQITVEGTIPMEIPQITFMQSNNYLMVTNVSESGVSWDNIIIIGTATKPTGTIEVGDIITDCSGEVTVAWQYQLLLWMGTFS